MLNEPKIAVIIPVYGQFEYAARAARTALLNSQMRSVVLWVDDASPEWQSDECQRAINSVRLVDTYRSVIRRFDTNQGLTAAWNYGLIMADSIGADYAVCGNSDLVFSKNWDSPIIAALETRGVDLVGPVTNAPGTQPLQDVDKYAIKYTLSDKQEDIDKVGKELARSYGSEFMEATLNGFCMVARTATWWNHAYDLAARLVFKPRNDFDSQGHKNPTPLMTLNEYELQRRWHAAGLRTGFCPGSFVFHYRAVSRGDQHKKGKWYRMDHDRNSNTLPPL